MLKNEWDTARPVKANLESMGLVFDANRALKTKSTKRKYVEKLSKGVEAAKEERDGDRVSDEEDEVEENEVVGKLRDEAERSGKKSTFRLPAEDVRLDADNYYQGSQVLLHFDLLTEILHCDLKTTNPSVKELVCPDD